MNIETYNRICDNDIKLHKIGESSRSNFIFSGSFNPLHDGHIDIIKYIQTRYLVNVFLEISISNVDKKQLTYDVLSDRLDAINYPYLYITNSSTFIEKSELFEHCTFIVGYDTISRIFDEDYNVDVDLAFEVFKHRCIKFIVFGRNSDDGFMTVSNNPKLTKYMEIITEIPESEFRRDISSTEIRGRV